MIFTEASSEKGLLELSPPLKSALRAEDVALLSLDAVNGKIMAVEV
jgi:hypothetical protein